MYLFRTPANSTFKRIKRCINITPTGKLTSSRSAKVTGIQWEIDKPTFQVPFTSDNYPVYKRDPKFAKVISEDIRYFKSILPPESVLVADGINITEDDLIPYNQDWFKSYRGKSQVVLRPYTTKQVSSLLSYCNSKRLAVVAQGGNTGASGGSVPIFDEIIINTSNLNRIREFDPLSGTISCDSGCILENLDNYLAQRGYIVPLDLGSKGSCQIGGNVSTNAGGIRLLRYGSLHGNVLGLEVVLADGTIIDGLSTLRKYNTGYDIKQLFIGSEGTLGIVTGVSLLTPKRPKFTNVALVGMKSYQNVQQAYLRAKEHLSEVLSAYEFWDARSMHYGRTLGSKKFRVPFEREYSFYVLMETSGSNGDHDSEKLNCFLESLLESNQVEDGVIAQDRRQYHNLWAIRESLGEACGAPVPIYKYDISLPVPVLYDIVEDLRLRLTESKLLGSDGPVSDVVGFGHMGDGNLHLTVFAKEFTSEVKSLIEPYVYEWTSRHNGSIAAEHGLGIKNSEYIGYSKPPMMVNMMRKIKSSLDPNGILNPYKVFPTS